MITMKDAPKVLAAATEPVRTLLLATAYAQVERERVDKIQRKVLDDLGYEKLPLKHDYQLPDDVAQKYYKRLNAIHLADGFEDAARGYCPALVAERLQTEAEWALFEAVEPLTGVNNNAILCGTKKMTGLEARKKYLDLLIGFVVNSPGFKHPLHGKAAR